MSAAASYFSITTKDVLTKQGEDRRAAIHAIKGSVARSGWVLVTRSLGRDGVPVERSETIPRSLSLAAAVSYAEDAAGPGERVELGQAVVGSRGATLYRSEGTYSLDQTVTSCCHGVDAVDLILMAMGRPSHIEAKARLATKAKAPQVNTDSILLAEIRKLVAEMDTAAAGTVDVMVADLVEMAALTDWTELGAEALRKKINTAATGILETGPLFAAEISTPLLVAGKRIVTKVRESVVTTYGWGKGGASIPPNGFISPTFSLVDKAAVSKIKSSAVNFVTDNFGNRSKEWSVFARDVVSHGVEQGLGRVEIAADLAKWIRLRGGDPAYNEVVASSYMVRARSWSQMHTYRMAGVEWMRISATMDEATSTVCLWLNGQHIKVGDGLQLYEDLEKLDDPNDVKLANPWIRKRLIRDEDGKPTGELELFVPTADGETRLAT